MTEHRLICPQELNQESGEDLLEQFLRTRPSRGEEILVDFSGANHMDARGGAWLMRISEMAATRGASLRWEGQHGQPAEFLDLIEPGLKASPPPKVKTESFVEQVGDLGIRVYAEIKQAINLLVDATYWTMMAPFEGRGFRWGLFIDEVYEMGVRALTINSVMNFLLGLIIAMLSAAQLRTVGLDIWVSWLVMIGFARELAAVMTGVVVSARTGAAIAAEISTMKVQEEIDALRGMGLNVPQFLVAPKLLAMMVVLPLLTGLGMIAGVLGGLVWGTVVLGFSAEIWLKETISAAEPSDIFQGLLKSFIFAQVIVLVGCHNGFRVEGGSRGVGLMTTRAVVMDIFFIIMIDMLFAAIFYYVLD
ncbi:MAG: hypothetical protein AMXMBFR84_40510 [Candidatus Hydrogenedentota bacterium]